MVAGHPWIYQGCILRLTAPAADGDLVQVKDHRQRFLGIGSQIFEIKDQRPYDCSVGNVCRSAQFTLHT